ncbi:MAG: hypothetical protein WBV82_09230 [Myxococcaceae bacterium]
MTVALQTGAQVALLEELTAAGAGDTFELTTQIHLMKDSDVGLPPGTLGRDMAGAVGRPPEVLADVPTLVNLLSFNEKVEPSTCAARIKQIGQLTAFGRKAAASPAARVLVLHTSDRVLPPEAFLRMSEPRAESPASDLMVWLDILGRRGEMKTRGLDALGLPEVILALAPDATETVTREAMDAVFTVAHQMLQRQSPLEDGTTIGHPGSTTYEIRSNGGVLRLAALRISKAPLWKRLFH